MKHSLDATVFDAQGRMRLLSADFWNRLDPLTLRTWANLHGRYVIPTMELVDWLMDHIAGRTCVEIGAGFGDVGRYVSAHMTDSAMQQRPEMLMYYRSLGQVPIDPPSDVERIDGVRAVEKHKPDVVLACFVTQLFQEGDDVRGIGSSVYGVDEDKILGLVDEYIHVGNEGVHGDKRILSLPHKTFKFPWIVTRAKDPSKNVIYVWRDC